MNNKHAIISFTFDDFPRSAAANGARILEDYGLCGTFYAAGSLCGQTVDGISYFNESDLSRLSAAGHEIGCHTFSHVRVSSLSDIKCDADLDTNASFVADLIPDITLNNFAYPFGNVSLTKKQRIQRRFSTCRSIIPGLNVRKADLGMLRAVRLYEHLTYPAEIKAVIDEAIAEKAWLIFYTHDVDEIPSRYGCTLTLFQQAVKMAATSDAQVLTMRSAMDDITYDLE